MKIKLFAYLAVFLLTISFASAWYDYTHQWICDQAGLSKYNCSIADNPSFQAKHPGTANKYHLCADDNPNCRARLAADKFFLTNPEVSLHLWADSKTPVHWHSFGSEGCHSEFEDCVDTNLRFGNTDWECSLECTDLVSRQKYKNEADYDYMLSVVDYVKEQYSMHRKKELLYKSAFAAFLVFIVIFATVGGKRHGKR